MISILYTRLTNLHDIIASLGIFFDIGSIEKKVGFDARKGIHRIPW